VERVEYLVVGGGIVGCSVALELARCGRQVVLVEAKDVACGASGGIGRRGVRANGRHPSELPLIRLAYDLWPGLAEDVGGPTGYERTGHLQLSEESGNGAYREQADRQRRAGIPSELVTGEGLRELEPRLSPRITAAVWCPLDGTANHNATTRSVEVAAVRHGAEIRAGVAVTELRRRGEGLDVVVGGDEELLRPTAGLLVAAGAATAELVATVGPALPTFTVFPHVLLTQPLETNPIRHLIGHAERPLNMKALPTGEAMITGGRLGRVDPRTGVPSVDPEQVRRNMEDAALVYPAFARCGIQTAVADRAEAATADLLPIVDRVPGAPRAWVATGWSGHGWAIAPAVAQLIAHWMADSVAPSELGPFGWGRF